ncbi:ALBINO3-like protein [Drosera capensis]
MATPATLRRLRRHHISPSLFHLLTRQNPDLQSPLPPPLLDSPLPSFHSPFLGLTHRRRFFSTRSSGPEISYLNHMMTSRTVSELETLGYRDGAGAAVGVGNGGWVWFDESFLPVRGLVALLDGVRDLTGLPWWIIIASSTLALRVTMLPLIILQLHKLKVIGQLFPKLPPPFPPPFSGKSIRDQFSLFRREKKAMGCPSFLWLGASLMVQAPCFLLWLSTIRRMSLGHHPGFDNGGILWFLNLSDYPHGILGPILPSLIAGLHLFTVQISFRSSAVGKGTGVIGLLAKVYKGYLNVLSVPIFYSALFVVPQGSLVYWVTNSSLTIVQQLALSHPAIREILGLPDKNASERTLQPEMALSEPRLSSPPNSKPIIIENLSPARLVNLSLVSLSQENQDTALYLLRLALDKDREYVKAMILMGQTMLQKGWESDAIKVLEHAISKLLSRPQTSSEALDYLILASTWAGCARARQGSMDESLAHLKRVALMPEPEDLKIKGHYYDGLFMYSSALASVGDKGEAIKYMEAVVAADPKYNTFLEQLVKGEEDFVDNLVESRRADY